MDKKQIEELLKRVRGEGPVRHIHTPYTETTGKKPDFEVEYIFDIDPALEGIKPSQGMRCDFLYEGDDPETDGIYMIWPEFIDEDGNVIVDKCAVIPLSGRAAMWIGDNEARKKIHQKRIKIGTKGYWVIGSKRLAKVKVTKVLGLHENS